ncbi:MAG: helix-turn-helix domain-containing protein [Maribacter sp.]
MNFAIWKKYQTSQFSHCSSLVVKYLNQVRQDKLGLTAKQIIQQRQITEAKRKLIKSEITTKELAFELGFESISSFSRFFKKNVGVSPTQFKALK